MGRVLGVLFCYRSIWHKCAACIQRMQYTKGLGLSQQAVCNAKMAFVYGNVSWSCTKISRILRNATYMGYICYNKSKVNNYLEKKRMQKMSRDIEEDEDWGPTIFDESEEEELIDDV